MKNSGIKVVTRKIDEDPTGGYFGLVILPDGSDFSTGRLRKGRTSAREDAVRLATSLARDPDFPIA